MTQPLNVRANFRHTNPNALQQPQGPPIAQIQTPITQMEMVNPRTKSQQPTNASVATKRKLADTMFANQQTHNINNVQPPQAQQAMYQQQPRVMSQPSKSPILNR